MRTRRSDFEHQDALNARLALLGAELAWLRPETSDSEVTGDGSRPGAAGSRSTAREPAAPPSAPAGRHPSSAGESTRPWWDEHTRVAAPSGAPLTPAPIAVGARSESGPRRVDPMTEATHAPPVGPAAGRHAARRPTREYDATPRGSQAGARATGRSPAHADPQDGLAERSPLGAGVDAVRLLLGPAQLTVVAVVAVLALGITCWWLARGRPETTVALQSAPASALTTAPSITADADSMPATSVRSDPSGTAPGGGSTEVAIAADASAAAGGSATAGATTGASVTVDVAGKVKHPGVEVLPSGARIVDALNAAGGARLGMDLTDLNLAQVLVDGQQVLVGVDGGPGTSSVSGPATAVTPTGGSTVGGSATGSTATTTAVQVVDLNTASAEQLDSLPDIGPVTAQSILSWREAHGGFTSVDELLEVDGIGQVTLGKLAPYVTV